VGEYLAGQLVSFHNIYFYLKLVEKAREAIFKDKFDEYYKEFYKNYTSQRWK
jgi:queuine tRNA-ribosyltransferase|tara:strand:+ start:59 stop:214 length:156 start_codon:yes stop_codon:yes gene_type:complete